MGPSFETEKHIQYFKRCLKQLPMQYTEADNNRMMLAFFSLSGLQLLGESSNAYKSIDWIYSLQTKGGFRSSLIYGSDKVNNALDYPHLTMTYAALASLLALGDDLSRVNKLEIIENLKSLQIYDGSFMPAPDSESDMRFVYCACVISHILNDWSGVDVDKATEFILKCQNYDYGFAQRPGQESHGGSMYCAIASLKLMSKLSTVNTKRIANWCLNRQTQGFSGRIQKPNDCCYSYWIGATLSILDCLDYVDQSLNSGFILDCQFSHGGFGKDPNSYPDVLHSYMAICGLSLMRFNGIKEIDPLIAISREASDRLREIKL